MTATANTDAVLSQLGIDGPDLKATDLASDKTLLQGAWESSQEGLEYYRLQKEAASANIAKASRLETEAESLVRLRSAWKTEKSRLDDAVKSWETAHDAMVRAIQPYSSVGVEQRVKRQMLAAESQAQSLERSTTAVDSSFIEKFREARKQFYVCSAISESMQ